MVSGDESRGCLSRFSPSALLTMCMGLPPAKLVRFANKGLQRLDCVVVGAFFAEGAATLFTKTIAWPLYGIWDGSRISSATAAQPAVASDQSPLHFSSMRVSS